VAMDDDLELSKLSLAQLEQLSKRVADQISEKRAAGRRWLRDHAAPLVEEEGPRYRNPLNSAETWSGKGAKPAWVEAALAEGKRLEQFEDLDNRPISGGGRRSPAR
jgi:DNA-binding protein H-NS